MSRRKSGRNSRYQCLRHEALETRAMLAGDVSGPWINNVNALDVNNDGGVTAVDALIIINHLSRDEQSTSTPSLSKDLSSDANAIFSRDTNGDGVVTALDALLVINHLANAELAAAQDPTSDEVGFEWNIAFGPDSPMGADIHSESMYEATLVRPINDAIGFESYIDTPGDVDWFLVQAETDGVMLEVRGADGNAIKFDVFDADGTLLNSVASLSGTDGRTSGTYLSGDKRQVFVRVAGQVGRYSFGLSDTGFNSESLAGQSVDTNGIIDLERLHTEALTAVEGYQASIIDVVPDSNLGDDIHDGYAALATTWSSDDNHSRASFIDFVGDQDVYRLRYGTGVISVSVHSDEIENIQLTATDYAGNEIAPLRQRSESGAFGFDLSEYDFPEFVDSNGRARRDIFVRVSASDGEIGKYTLLRSRKAYHGMPVESIAAAKLTPLELNSALPRVRRADDIIGFDAHGSSVNDATEISLSAPITEVSSFLDTPADHDAFRFSANSEQITLTVQRHHDLARFDEGIVELFDVTGNRLDPVAPAIIAVNDWQVPEYQVTYRVDNGTDYIAIVSTENESAFGRYSLLLESEGSPDVFITPANFEILTFAESDELNFTLTTKLTSSAQGNLRENDPIDVYRFSTSAVDIAVDLTGFGPFQMQLFDSATGEKLNERTGVGRISESLPSSHDNLVRDYLLAVWSPGVGGDYSLDVDLRVLPVNPDRVGDTLANAEFIDVAEQHTSASGFVSQRASLNLDLGSAQDVDVYRFVANNSTTKVSTIWNDDLWLRSEHLGVEIVDANGDAVALLADYGPAASSRLNTRRFEFDTDVGKTYFVRFSVLDGGPLATRVSVR